MLLKGSCLNAGLRTMSHKLPAIAPNILEKRIIRNGGLSVLVLQDSGCNQRAPLNPGKVVSIQAGLSRGKKARLGTREHFAFVSRE